ncbi:retinol dehydrogenase 11-like [Homarus americanus]|uniref:Retinol dehydrogenase 11-like 2 n=1 Tax=Homarus americanus TaxID=6706 RepID=A0A8J5JK61_HOMAM|nr:retinol dehydrogenase 11-like [Homarus americanus]XP_042207346.1 retinol dehydrogenase 11-like [Homarus americanus]XP_042207347.1 retinol dehydrogenase 11-like [Homarus americanus]KAG7154554.1 Retinol dehydrogenase 11-like 2 [Homarus americanus]
MSWPEVVKWFDQNKIVLIAVTCSVVGAGGFLVGLRVWLQGPSCKSKARLDGKTVIITGSNTGIGKETARDLSRRGARVVMLCRDLQKAKVTAEEIHQETGNTVGIYQLDLASLESIRNTANTLKDTEPNIHILINNAGVMMCPRWETKDGFEMQLGTNHLGHFLLTLLLLDQIKASAPARIITVSSIAHTQGRMHWEDLQMKERYEAKEAYCQSKLANVLFSRELSRQLQGTGVTTYSLHPGVVQTELGRHIHQSVNGFIHWAFHFFGNFFFKTVVRGAQTTIHCAVEESLATTSGKYYSDCAEKQPHPLRVCDDDARRLWDTSLQLVGLDHYSA